jgi:hypothetical protein
MIRMLFSVCFIAVIHFTASAQVFELPIPAGWSTETFAVPMDFAPKVKYSGEEHIRFAPGWGDPKSEELWTYCFLWWIKPDSKVSKEILEEYLQSYYSGLVGRNIVSRKIDSAIVVPTVASFNQVSSAKGDSKTFQGTVKMLDYLGLRPVTLNIDVHVIPCMTEGHLAVFLAISPQPKEHRVWKELNSVREGFRCGGGR